MLKDFFFKCISDYISDYLQREDIDIVSALQVTDTIIDTIKTMRNATTFKKFYDEASKLADNLGIEVSEPCSRKISRRLDENQENQHVMVSNEEKFCVTFFYEVLDVIYQNLRANLIKSQGSFDSPGKPSEPENGRGFCTFYCRCTFFPRPCCIN